MSQLLDSAETIVTVAVTFLVVLGVIWRIQGSSDDGIENALLVPRSRSNQDAAGDDLRHRIEDIEKTLGVYRKHIIRIERRLIGAGTIVWALICAVVSLSALARNELVPGLCFLAMAISFGFYGLVKVFSNKSSRHV